MSLRVLLFICLLCICLSLGTASLKYCGVNNGLCIDITANCLDMDRQGNQDCPRGEICCTRVY